jgi:hypothetical protein
VERCAKRWLGARLGKRARSTRGGRCRDREDDEERERTGDVAGASHVFVCQRRMATYDQMISTTPKGHAPLAKPYTLERTQPSEKRMIKIRERDSSAYINIMNVTTTTP